MAFFIKKNLENYPVWFEILCTFNTSPLEFLKKLASHFLINLRNGKSIG
jgi:hypothetical protein